MPKVPEPDLAAEVSRLRDDLAALRTELATEVRTRRIVVADEQDSPVIEGSGDDSGTHLLIGYGDPTLVAGRWAQVHVLAGLGASEGEMSHALVECSVGDDSYATLGITRHDTPAGHRDESTVALWQHSQTAIGDNEFITTSNPRVDAQVTAHAPMVQVMRP